MDLRVLLLCAVLPTLPSCPAEALEFVLDTGTLAGPLSDQRPTGANWLSVQATPLHGGGMGVVLPGFSGILSWDASRSEWVWLGWTQNEEDSQTNVLSIGSMPGLWSARWDEYPFEARFGAPWFVAADHAARGFELGGAALGLNGALEASIPLDQGQFHGRSQVVWGGVPSSLAFLGDVAFDAQVGRDLYLGGFSGTGSLEGHFGGALLRSDPKAFRPSWSWSLIGFFGLANVKIEARKNLFLEGTWTTLGNSRGTFGAFWAEQEWLFGDWTLGLGSGFGLLSIRNPTWAQQRTWTEAVFTWPWPIPSLETRNSTREYTFTADPAWGLLVHPALSWRPVQHCELTLSRWLPLTGGWAYRDSSEPAPGAASASAKPGRPTPQQWNDLLWAGTQLSVNLAW